jgi:hypothetical protein
VPLLLRPVMPLSLLVMSLMKASKRCCCCLLDRLLRLLSLDAVLLLMVHETARQMILPSACDAAAVPAAAAAVVGVCGDNMPAKLLGETNQHVSHPQVHLSVPNRIGMALAASYNSDMS